MKSFILIAFCFIFLAACQQNKPNNPGIPSNNMPADSVPGVDSLTRDSL
ncbi:hypothetical protein PBAC_14490 [Pedobacter glucosidilyticus]|nr:hypothetical protein [Pedobacter aquae]KHJ38443.1 hypothetical protein PBAC_14490 [Pedobacter glucosidilyticus]